MISRPRDWLLIPLMFVVVVVCSFWGGRSAWNSLRNLSPTEMTCADFLAKRPSAAWVQLSSCVPDFSNIAVLTYDRDVAEVYIPLWPTTSQRGPKAQVVLASNRQPLLQLGERTSQIATDYVATLLAKPIDGMVEGIFDRSERERSKIRELGLDIADDFAIVEWRERPRPMWLSLGMLAIAGTAFWWLRRKWLRRPRSASLAKASIIHR